MTFANSVVVCLREYSKFSGRASRSEYWWWQFTIFLIFSIVPLLCAFIGFMLYAANDASSSLRGLIIGDIIGFVMCLIFLMCPILAVTVRRLHDTGHSGWWLFITLVPFIGSIWLLVLLLLSSQDENQYGYPVY